MSGNPSPRGRARGPVTMVAATLMAIALMAVLTASASAAAMPSTSITLNRTSPGRVFDGDGAVSGGGGNSRLLYDYPRPERTAILNYLFTPGYGADVQMLKLETGGSGNSTSGAEPSIEETEGHINCNVGYEFWLGEQAQRRNPNIKLYGLTWSAPGWVGSTLYNANGIKYIADWLGCARQHGLRISYIGGWNEHGYNAAWFPQLRATLDQDGFADVKVVAADANDPQWSTATAVAADPAFKQAIYAVSNHYPCGPYDGTQSDTRCATTPTAEKLGLPLWAGENGSLDENLGAAPLARSDNLVYLQGDMTANIDWPIISAAYPDVPFNGQGLLQADQPWSGHFTVGQSLWAMAQTTQFTQPGWRYLDDASGYLGGSSYTEGSYVSLIAPHGRNWSTIVETTRATGPQRVRFDIGAGLSTRTIHVWSTNYASSDPSTWFERDADIAPNRSGRFSMVLQPNMSYSFTTTRGQGHGQATDPPAAPLTLPFNENFDTQPLNAQPKDLGTMEGAFDIQPCVGRPGRCVQQETPVEPLEWQTIPSGENLYAYTAGGGLDWSNYQVSADVMNATPGAVGIMGRQQSAGQNPYAGEDPTHVDDYSLTLSNTGTWTIERSDFTGTITPLATGTVPGAAGLNSWHELALTFDGSDIIASVDGTQVGSVTDTAYTEGKVGLLTAGYLAGDQYDDMRVTPLTAPAVPVTLPAASAAAPTTVSVPFSQTGSSLDQWDYIGSWTANSADETSTTPGDNVSLNFEGTAVTLDATTGPAQGTETVSVDGGAPKTVDLYSASPDAVNPVFSVSGLAPNVQHTLTVSVTGDKNAASTGVTGSVASASITTPPVPAPVVLAPADHATVKGSQVKVLGTSAPGALIGVSAGGAAVCPSITADAEGQWSCIATLPSGAVSLSAVAADPLTGVQSAASAPVALTVPAGS